MVVRRHRTQNQAFRGQDVVHVRQITDPFPAGRWLPYPERAALGVYTLTERVHLASTWIEAHQPSLRRV